METKKTPRAELDDKRPLFVQIGLIVALAAMLVAFEWKTYDVEQIDLGGRQVEYIEDDLVEITIQNKLPPPPAPPLQTTVLNIVPDEQKVEDVVDINVEATEKTIIPTYTPPDVQDEVKVIEDEIFTVVEHKPLYIGGEIARIKFLQENLIYPQLARETGIQGTVYVTFVVEKDGGVTDIRVLRGIGGGCDEEAVRVISSMPRWIPAKQRSLPVRFQFTMPIKFTLAM